MHTAPSPSNVRLTHEGWGEAIAKAMADKDVSGRELARRCGTNPSTISRILSGKQPPTDAMKWKIAAALEERLDVLFAYPRYIPERVVAA